MSWSNELYKVYESFSGKSVDGVPLLPVSHTTANAQIELVISENGDYRGASCVAKDDTVTVIPVTEKSGTRTSGVSPHPFADKLVYIAGDYGEHVQGKRADNGKYYSAYMEQLKSWRDSEYSHPAVRALCAYLEKATLISDLTAEKVLVTDPQTGKLNDAKINGIAQEDCMVRVRVEYADLSKENKTWADNTLFDSFINWNSNNAGEPKLCYALGKELPVTYSHPTKIRNAGDKAKLISTNDESGFSYRGRFKDKTEAVSVSYEFSQKMHNALSWLIKRQAVNFDSLTVLAWNTGLDELPDITAAGWDFFGEEMPFMTGQDVSASDLDDMYRKRFCESVLGRRLTLDPDDNTMVMLLDSATTGRLSMPMYTELKTADLIENLSKWHSGTSWNRFNGKLKKSEISSFSMSEIAKCAFGTEGGSGFIDCKPDIRKDVAARLVPCAVEGRKLPSDIMTALVRKAENPLAYKNEWNWRTVLEAACAFYRKYQIDYYGRYCSMALDKNCKSRDYLFGRLLAVADYAERSTYSKDEARVTNARNLFNAFANHPCHMWGVIEDKLAPYLNRMSEGKRAYFQRLIGEIMNDFSRDDFNDNSKLKPEFLLGYHCQLNEFYTKNETENKENEEE